MVYMAYVIWYKINTDFCEVETNSDALAVTSSF